MNYRCLNVLENFPYFMCDKDVKNKITKMYSFTVRLHVSQCNNDITFLNITCTCVIVNNVNIFHPFALLFLHFYCVLNNTQEYS